MIRLFINALAASAGGGITYIKNVVPELAARADVHTTVLVAESLRQQLPKSENVVVLDHEMPSGTLARFWQEQRRLPDLIRASRADVLVSAGNFALRKSPVPQILLSRNSLYTSRDFYADLRHRGEYRMLAETKIKGALAKASVGWADATVAPSQSFANELTKWTGKPVQAIYHGFDRRKFVDNAKPLPSAVEEKLARAGDALKLLFVSHYNYYRNFETLFRALPLIRDRLAPRPVKLFVTCKLQPGENPGAYRTEAAAALIEQLGISENLVQLGAVPYESLGNLYRACDVYVTPAYTETFAHPLVEAMACGRPVVAADIPVHREIAGSAGVFFSTFSPESIADNVLGVALGPRNTSPQLAATRVKRSKEFSWAKHVEELLAVATKVSSGSELVDYYDRESAPQHPLGYR